MPVDMGCSQPVSLNRSVLAAQFILLRWDSVFLLLSADTGQAGSRAACPQNDCTGRKSLSVENLHLGTRSEQS